MGAKSSTAKGADLHVATISLGDAPQRASGIAISASGQILIGHASRILLLDIPRKNLTTFAGKSNTFGNTEGHRLDQAQFQQVSDLLAVDQSIYIIDSYNCKVRLLKEDIVSTFAGNGDQAIKDGPRNQASFFYPQSISQIAGRFFVTDIGAGSIRIISPDGIVSTLKNTPDTVKWRWKTLLNESENSLKVSGHTSTSTDSPHKYQSLKQTGESNNDIFFDEHEDGKLKFGTLKGMTTSHAKCNKKYLYLSDEIKKHGRTMNRMMKFDVEKMEVEMLMASFSTPKDKQQAAQGKIYEGGRLVQKDGACVNGMLVISVTEDEESDELMMVTDRDHHVVWSVRVNNGEGSGMRVMGKEGDSGGCKDGNLKGARLEAPECPFLTPEGHMIWIDSSEKSGSKLRVIKEFGRAVPNIKEELKTMSTKSTTLNSSGEIGSRKGETTSYQLSDDGGDGSRNTVAGTMIPRGGLASSYGGSLDSTSFHSINSTSPIISPTPSMMYPASTNQIPTRKSPNHMSPTPPTSPAYVASPSTPVASSSSQQKPQENQPPMGFQTATPGTVTQRQQLQQSQQQQQQQQQQQLVSASNSMDSLPSLHSSTSISTPTSPHLAHSNNHGSGSLSITPTRSWMAGNSSLYAAQRGGGQLHNSSSSGPVPFFPNLQGSSSSLALSSSTSSLSSLTSSSAMILNNSTATIFQPGGGGGQGPQTYDFNHPTSHPSSQQFYSMGSNISTAPRSGTTTATTATTATSLGGGAPDSISSLSSSSSAVYFTPPASSSSQQVSYVGPIVAGLQQQSSQSPNSAHSTPSPSNAERLAAHRQKSRPDINMSPMLTPQQSQTSGQTPISFSFGAATTTTTTSSSSSLSPTSAVPHKTISIPSPTFSLDPSDLMSDWTVIEPNLDSKAVPLSSSPSPR
jgi:hypothetical protein